jgi:hypothetical protein
MGFGFVWKSSFFNELKPKMPDLVSCRSSQQLHKRYDGKLGPGL